MSERERLINRIEEERSRLNLLLESGADIEEMYAQSQAVDLLIEYYMEHR